MIEKIAFVFPGQGAQHIGMAKDIYNEFAAARDVFDNVCDLSCRDIKKICFDGTAADLNVPVNTSLATFAHSVSVANVIQDEFKKPLYEIGYAIVGHSMGQYSALHCAGSISMADVVNILEARSVYMTMNAATDGGMVCIVGLPLDEIRQVLKSSVGYGYAEISNHNAYDQFVISGQNRALDVVLDGAKSAGARVAKRLNVAIPAHCALMANAEKKLRDRLADVEICAPKTNWFSNQTANIMCNPRDVKDALVDQMTHGVRWYEIMQKFPVYNISRAYELGPGRVLTGLINRADIHCRANSTGNLHGVNHMLREIEQLMNQQAR